MAEKKNPDYSASAVNLCNPPELGQRLMAYRDCQAKVRILEANLEALPEFQELQACQKKIANINAEIRGMVDAQGSYQDIENGFYAVKQLKKTKLYSATNFESCFPEYATAVLTKSINVPVLEGLIKGNLLNEDGLRRAHIIEDKETFAYIVK